VHWLAEDFLVTLYCFILGPISHKVVNEFNGLSHLLGNILGVNVQPLWGRCLHLLDLVFPDFQEIPVIPWPVTPDDREPIPQAADAANESSH
jgi:hypothetical protein